MKSMTKTVKVSASKAIAEGLKDTQKPSSAEILAELQDRFWLIDPSDFGAPTCAIINGEKVDAEAYADCIELVFSSKEEEEEFDQNLLETKSVARRDGRAFGYICWDLFEESHPSWTKNDYKSGSWAGGGFYSLPTVEDMEGGTALFVAESQLEALSQNPWICQSEDWNQQKVYVHIQNVDELVIVPDELIMRKRDNIEDIKDEESEVIVRARTA